MSLVGRKSLFGLFYFTPQIPPKQEAKAQEAIFKILCMLPQGAIIPIR